MTRPPIDPACVLFWGSGLLFSVAVWVWLLYRAWVVLEKAGLL